jgi:DNA-binding transcriptional LysR family regulator
VAQAAEDARRVGSSELRLCASVTIGEFLLPGWLSAFRHARPDVRPQLEITNSTGVLAAVREHRCEIGFVEGLDPLEGLEALTLTRDEIVAVVAASHPWARRRALSPSELLKEAYLTREAASGTRAVATAALATAGIELHPVLQAASAQTLKRALEDGGFTLISRITIEAEQRAGTLKGIPIRGLDLSRELRGPPPQAGPGGPSPRPLALAEVKAPDRADDGSLLWLRAPATRAAGLCVRRGSCRSSSG